MKLIKRIAEALYFKCYPERKKEHEIAWQPPIIKETRADVVTLKAQIVTPTEYSYNSEWIRKELSAKLESRLEPEIEIRAERDYINNTMIYTGMIRVVRR
jgi:hypothetical protein